MSKIFRSKLTENKFNRSSELTWTVWPVWEGMFLIRLLEGWDVPPDEGAKYLEKNDEIICGSCTGGRYFVRIPKWNNRSNHNSKSLNPTIHGRKYRNDTLNNKINRLPWL
jgi:hypothetical protein